MTLPGLDGSSSACPPASSRVRGRRDSSRGKLGGQGGLPVVDLPVDTENELFPPCVPGEIEERLDGASGTAERHKQREWREVDQEEAAQSAEQGNRDPSTGWSQRRMLVEDGDRGTMIGIDLIER